MAIAKEINLADFGKELKKIPTEVKKEVMNTVYSVALEKLQDLVEKTPVDTGALANSWEVIKNQATNEESVILGNFQSYATIMLESGAKPFTPNLKALQEWAGRKLKKPVESKEAQKLAWGTFHKIKREGITAKFIFSDFLEDVLIPEMRERIYKNLEKG